MKFCKCNAMASRPAIKELIELGCGDNPITQPYGKGVFLSYGHAIRAHFLVTFYRAMHFSAKRGIAIACRLSVCL